MKKLGLLLAWLMTFPLAILAQSTSRETATELSQGETITYDYVKNDGSFIYWKFTTTETGTIRLIVKRTNIKRQTIYGGNTTTQLYYANPDGTVVKLTEIENSDTLTFENAKPGQYYARAYFSLLKSCTYKLTYKFTPGSTTPDDGDMVERKFLVVETKDHVKTTYMLSDKPQVTFTDEAALEFDRLRDFMYENVYFNPVAKREDEKARGVVEALYTYYLDHVELLPEEFLLHLDEDGEQRITADFIACMTDNYAIHEYQRLFVPAAWN